MREAKAGEFERPCKGLSIDGRRGIIATSAARCHRYTPYNHALFPVDCCQRGPRLHKNTRRQRSSLAHVRGRVTSILTAAARVQRARHVPPLSELEEE